MLKIVFCSLTPLLPVCLAASCVLQSSHTISQTFVCDIIDVGQGSSTLFYYQEKIVLIDNGADSTKFQNYMINIFQEKFQTNIIDYMIFTHPDADHINNTKFLYDNFQINHTYLPLVYANEKISDVDNFTPQIQKKTQTYQTCVTSVLNEPDSTWEFLTSDDVDDIPGFKIFQSNKDDWTNVNDFSPIIYFLPNTTYTFCITGDSTTTKENWYLNSNLPAFTVKYYIIAHHGSGDSSSAQLLAQLRPQYTFYSSFDPNANYGHPHISTCQRIKVYTNEIYGTEYNGTISINDGQVNENLVLTTTAWTKKNGERIII